MNYKNEENQEIEPFLEAISDPLHGVLSKLPIVGPYIQEWSQMGVSASSSCSLCCCCCCIIIIAMIMMFFTGGDDSAVSQGALGNRFARDFDNYEPEY
jgi:hypothetical protein